MKVIIYFGHHKVGSTALQSFLAGNAIALLRQGILYPAVESQGMAHMMQQLLQPKTPPQLNCMNLREPHNALAFRMMASKPGAKTPPWHGPLPGQPAMLRAIRHQIEVLQPHTVILCSEVFSNFGVRDPNLIRTLHEQFPDAEFELYCALRRPDEYMASWFGQRLRFGQTIKALNAGTAQADMNTIHFDYQKMIAPWITVFDGAPLHLRNYQTIMAAGGSVRDFTTQVSCKFPGRLATNGPSNHGLVRAAYEIMRRANQDLPPEEARQLMQFLLKNGAERSPTPNHEVELFGAELRQELAARFEPINQYLGGLTGRTLFFDDADLMRQTNPVDSIDASRRLLENLLQSPPQRPALQTYLQTLTDQF